MVNPTPKKITSLQNFLVKEFVKIREDRVYRQMQRQVAVSGEKIVREMQQAPRIFLKNEKCALNFPCETYLVTEEILKKVSGLKSPPSCVALYEMPVESLLKGKKFLVACDKISDPGNLGTIVRSALALGWEGIFLLDDSVDLFNDKVVRASRGGSLLLPYCYSSLDKMARFAKEERMDVLVADLEGEKLENVKVKEGAILLLGTEGVGQREEAHRLGKKITIPIQGMESLNVATAASILMYALRAP